MENQACAEEERSRASAASTVLKEKNTANPAYPKLRSATPGRFSCAFTAAPNSFLNLAQAKSLINCAYYSDHYRGELVVRIDDSGDPSIINASFEAAIIQDLKILGITPDRLTRTSDYFIACEQLAAELIRLGRAYMDIDSGSLLLGDSFGRSCRGRPPEESLRMFHAMCLGKLEGTGYCLRARASMNLDALNMNGGTSSILWVNDPIIYQHGNMHLHYRTGCNFWAYPTPLFSRPIVDAIEGITHTLISSDEDDSFYYWVQKSLQLRPVVISSFGKVELVDTVSNASQNLDGQSNNDVVIIDSTDLPTIRDLIRRGMSMGPFRAHLLSLGISKRVTQIKWDSLWCANRKFLEPFAPRYMAIRSKGCVHMTVSRMPASSTSLTIPMHPRNVELGERMLHVGDTILLDAQDAESIEEGEEVTLLRWTSVLVTNIHRSPSKGTPLSLESDFLPVFKFLKKKKAVTWLASRPDLVPLKLVQFGPLQLVTRPSGIGTTYKRSTVCVDAFGDPALRLLKENDIIQLERLGFFRVDIPFSSCHEPMVLFMIPDGKSKNKHCSIDPQIPISAHEAVSS